MKHVLWRAIEVDDTNGIARLRLRSRVKIKKFIIEDNPNKKVTYRKETEEESKHEIL